MANLEKAIENVTAELQVMRQKGWNGHLDDSHAKPTRDQFMNNYREFKNAENRLYQSQNNAKLKEQLNFQVGNYRGILIRQVMTGIFKEPSGHYLGKLNEHRALAAQASKLTGKTYPSGAENEITFTL